MKTLLRSFAGGEIAPELFARLDTAKFQTGLQKCLNFEVRPHGPVVNRAGTEYILETKTSAKRSVLIPFIFSTSQAYALEFGDLYMRIHTLAATVLTTGVTITGVTKANPGVVTYTGTDPANGTWLYLSSIGGMTELNGRYVKVANVNGGANTFELTDLNNANINTTSYTTYTSGGTASAVYEIVSPYAEADLEELEITQSSDVLTITHVGYPVYELRRVGATNWTFTAVTVTPAQAAPTGITVTPNAGGGVSYEYTVTAVSEDGREESLKGTPVANAACQDLSVAGAHNTITFTDAAGAVRYNVYRNSDGLYGYIGQCANGTVGFADYNVTPDMTQTPPEQDDPVTGADNRPGAVGYFQSRRWFAGSNNKPSNVWASRSGTESNFTYSIPTQDSDAITARLTSRRANTILHLVELGDLLALTSSAEWLINNGGGTGPITPGNIDYRVQGGTGASYVRPVITDNSVLYAAAKGGHVREIEFSWQSQGYKSRDLSLMAPHLFDGYTITSMAWTRGPNPTCWCVRSDGLLLGLTYVPEHEVIAWHQHSTLGSFESVVAIPEGADDVLYFIVKRTIGGGTKRYVERLHSRQFATLADSFIVDAGLFYNGSAATTLGGLWHLVGETVSILADGAVVPQQTVSAAGQITLTVAASKVAIGKQITADLQTLPLTAEVEAFGQADQKNVNSVSLRINQSSACFIGPSFTELRETKHRTTEPYGSPPALRTGVVETDIVPSWGVDGTVCIRQTNPLPLTIVGIVPDAEYGG